MRFSIAPSSPASRRLPHARAALVSAACVTLLGVAAPLSAQTIGVYVGDSARIELAPSAKLTVPLRADLQSAGGASIASLQGRLGWSSSRLTLDSIRAISGWTLTANQDSVAVGRLAFSTFGTAVLPASGPVATAYFTASATSGGTRIAFSPEAIGDEAGNSVMPLLQVRGQDVCVGITGKWGDVTEDGVVSVMDAQQIARSTVALAISRPAALAARGDVSADGAINIIDAQQIARYGVGLSAAARVNVAITPAPTVSSLLLTTVASAVLVPGNTVQLSAEPRDGTGASVAGCPPMAWTSSNPTVATVNGSGLVTVLTPGAVTITVGSGGVSASSALTIGAIPIAGASITAGNRHACALTSNGKAYCWGHNVNFHVGDGTSVSRSQPVPVSTDLSFLSISAGVWHTCGVTTTRAIYCWGPGWNGRLGDGTTTSRSAPNRVSSNLSFARVSAGNEFTCALTDVGAAYCWGPNEGQLGDGTTTERWTPTPVQGGLAFRSIDAGARHVCALTAAGAAYCWGNNDGGNLGDGFRTARPTPTLVSGGLTFAEISVGNSYSCGRTTAGTAFCWGEGSSGQLGTGVNDSFLVPTPVAGTLVWRNLSAGGATTCGVASTGTLYCWGENSAGQVGDGSRVNRFAPVAVLGNTSEVTVGLDRNVCAVQSNGAAQCWGLNNDGALGRGFDRFLAPTAIAGAPVLTSLAANDLAQSTCGLTASGNVQCWGNNGAYPAFGAQTTSLINDVPVPGGQGVTLSRLSGASYHTCGVTATNQGYCWGANFQGALGSGSFSGGDTPVAVVGGRSFSKIDVGVDHSCGLATDGKAYCWGLANDGRLGNGSSTGHVFSPALVLGNLVFTDVSNGNGHSCGIATGGAAYCWGGNGNGQLGDGTSSNSSTPVAVSGGLTFSRIEAGWDFSCGLLTDGRVACWGSGGGGRLGNGSTSLWRTPRLISSSLTFTTLEAITDRACALTATGELYCWGRNHVAQVGTGNTVDVWTPVRIGGTRTFIAVAGTSTTTCAIGTDTQTYCWGDNTYGQAGQRQTLTPQPVLGGLTFRTP
jgi:alpha-tubulin suppressor-like RCC1 family protein